MQSRKAKHLAFRNLRTHPRFAGTIEKINMKLQNLIHIVIGILCIGLFPGTQAGVPAPDGDYSGGKTAKSDNALFSLTTDSWNAAPSSAAEFAASDSVQVHETRADPQETLQFPTTSEITTPVEPFTPAPPTRCSFM